MKYQYVAEIGKALTTIKRHFLPADPDESVPAETLNAIAKDVDAVIPLLKQYEWEFVADNSDRAAAGAKMPPELIKLEINLQDCRGLCRRIADEILQDDESGREAWSRRKGFFDWWLRLLWEYYPSLELRERPPLFTIYRRPSPQAEKHRPKSGTLSDYLVGVDEASFTAEISPKVQGKKGTAIGQVVHAEIKKGRLLNKRGYLVAFLRAFGVEDQLQGVYNYLKRRPDTKVIDDDAE